MRSITIVDFGAGNLRSVQKAFELFSPDVRVTSNPKDIPKADRLVLPGVGAFGDCIRNIEQLGLKVPLLEYLASGRPFLGICVGLQLLFTESEEKGIHRGLGAIPGRVVRFAPDVKVPQIGWNQVAVQKPIPLFQGLPDNTFFYFVHSYYVVPDSASDTAGLTDYGLSYASVVARDHVFGVQFHPEKSQKAGLKVLDNFCNI
jgi:imidazole glycerol-phosphate synthase subunit HisH